MSRKARDDREGKEGRNFSGNASFSDNWYELWYLLDEKGKGDLGKSRPKE